MIVSLKHTREGKRKTCNAERLRSNKAGCSAIDVTAALFTPYIVFCRFRVSPVSSVFMQSVQMKEDARHSVSRGRFLKR